MDSLRRLEEIFTHFPGIGPRQARRFVYYILNKPASSIRELATLMNEVKKETMQCSQCSRFHLNTDTRTGICTICSDTTRDNSLLMIVARDNDFESIERSGAYRGLYYVLGGTVPILDQDPEKRIRLKSLIERVDRTAPREIILSMSATPDGENTSQVIIRALKGKKITILGRGLSTGSELEYADSETIRSALSNRK